MRIRKTHTEHRSLFMTMRLRIEDYVDGNIRVKCGHHAVTGKIIEEFEVTRDMIVEDGGTLRVDHPKVKFYNDLGKFRDRASSQ